MKVEGTKVMVGSAVSVGVKVSGVFGEKVNTGVGRTGARVGLEVGAWVGFWVGARVGALNGAWVGGGVGGTGVTSTGVGE